MTKYCFKTDDDCCWYLIPTDKSNLFENMFIECLDLDDWSEFEFEFGGFRIDSPKHYIFENPEEI